MRESIQDIWSKFKSIITDETVFTSLLVLLVAIGSFGLGRLSVSELIPQGSLEAAVVLKNVDTKASNGNIEVKEEFQKEDVPVLEASASSGMYVGSKNGTKFHLPSCPGAGQIKSENKVYFNSKQDAYSKGYTEAANCKGI